MNLRRALTPGILLIVPLLAGLVPAGPLGAQSCPSEWRRPVVCRLEVRWSSDGRDWERLRPGKKIRIPAGQSVLLEVRAEDQYGWEFPEDRLLVGLEPDRDCGDLLTVREEGGTRHRITAGTRRGSCTAILWVPGNLNVERELAIEVRSRAETGYEWEQARYIARALYLGILGREPDREGWDAATAEIQRGRLESQVDAMVRSREFQERKRGLSAPEILASLYRGILRREPDSAGVRTYLRDVERGRITGVVLRMVRSPEFEENMLANTRLRAME